ncbi:hypothetical protein Cpap_1530 [Ruminiclostridium papyrosolvens DSM 2782]|uniref:Uncharacterized protein n=1 Tax=Ruminiclostridium papyrosolvens DSM 2782 TaxID=588581 RepID=F1TEH2_9FIRM|nr:hypothetical protein [Ruminiclostridium papyrosolvens]EGD47138.1 hypothetical protein Cpap_1530 [Ruminiclostridium papyrosolvens DSM 2782]WES36080.1 hypothetical protein P0092_08990 [Ruminiclostridium papyrosolvens DSM 2782]WES36178.1 hypothetical protein P0092_09490 [Ruminiclostridium papyrosolvens DSM 2782]
MTLNPLREILNKASYEAGMPISDKDFIKHYNKCLSDLSDLYDTAKATQEQTIVCEDINNKFPLLNNCTGINQVLSPEGFNIRNFKIIDGKYIQFYWRGTYTVREYILNTQIASLNEDFELNPVYERCIPIYIAAQMVKKVDKDNYKELMSEFTELAALANSSIRKVSNRYRQIKAPRFR